MENFNVVVMIHDIQAESPDQAVQKAKDMLFNHLPDMFIKQIGDVAVWQRDVEHSEPEETPDAA